MYPQGTASSECSLPIAALTTFSGGFLDAFTYVGQGGVFANSMTGNIVLMGISAASGDWQQVFHHIPPLMAFLSGIYMVHKNQLVRFNKDFRRFARGSLWGEIIILLLVAMLPKSFPDSLIVPAIAFVASIQYESFAQLEGYTYNSVTTSANLKRFSEALFDYRHTDMPDSKRRLGIFGIISICFLAGAAIGGWSTRYFFNAALSIPILALAIVIVLTTDKWNSRFNNT